MQIYLFLFLHMAKTPQSQYYETYILVQWNPPRFFFAKQLTYQRRRNKIK